MRKTKVGARHFRFLLGFSLCCDMQNRRIGEGGKAFLTSLNTMSVRASELEKGVTKMQIAICACKHDETRCDDEAADDGEGNLE